MIKISKKEWNNICTDYKGIWSADIVNYRGLDKSLIGKRTMMNNECKLLTEGIHFIIE